MSSARDKQTAEAKASGQQAGSAAQHGGRVPVPDPDAQPELLGALAGAQAQDLLLRMGGAGGNRGVQTVVDAPVQRQAIDIVVPKRGKGPAPEPVDDRLIAMVLDGVMAFKELASFFPPASQESVPPVIPANVPAGLRPAFGHLLRAKEQHFQIGLPDATKLVRDRLFSEGAMGIARYLVMGPQLVLQEELERALEAKTQWWLARPIFKALVARFAATPGSPAGRTWPTPSGGTDHRGGLGRRSGQPATSPNPGATVTRQSDRDPAHPVRNGDHSPYRVIGVLRFSWQTRAGGRARPWRLPWPGCGTGSARGRRGSTSPGGSRGRALHPRSGRDRQRGQPGWRRCRSGRWRR